MARSNLRKCPICGISGDALHVGVKDVVFGTPGVWSVMRCPSEGMLWLEPPPTMTELSAAYGNYYTHSPNRNEPGLLHGLLRAFREVVWQSEYGYRSHRGLAFRAIGRAARFFAPLADWAGADIMWLAHVPGGSVLDVGSGDGSLLARLRAAGWNSFGVEPDPVAALASQQAFGLDVRPSLNEWIGSKASFDIIVLRHVLEHVEDPVSVLTMCQDLLGENGRLVVATPNAASFCHRLFGKSWRGLEPPRHLRVFSKHGLAECARRAGLHVLELRASGRSAAWMYHASSRIQAQDRRGRTPSAVENLAALAVYVLEACLLVSKGEELVLVANRNTHPSAEARAARGTSAPDSPRVRDDVRDH